ncbi:MAG: hypothetical protein ABSE16_09595 [Verrucomicrobiota bacterium]|jgi:hypothetical protein
MASDLLQIKGCKPVLKSRLAASAEKNNRSLNQEALERLERSFELEDALISNREQKWIDEALAGVMRPGSVARLRQIAAKSRRAAAA